MTDQGFSLNDLVEPCDYVRYSNADHTLISERRMTSFGFSEPKKTQGEGYIYAVFFDNGITKVGRTTNPHNRIGRHVLAAVAHGAPAYMVWVSGPHANARVNERAAIRYCIQSATRRIGKEYFEGVNSGRLVDWLDALEYLRLDRLTGRPVKRRPSVVTPTRRTTVRRTAALPQATGPGAT